MEVRAVVAVAVAVVVVVVVKWMARQIKMVAILRPIQVKTRVIHPMIKRVHPMMPATMLKAKIIPIYRTIPTPRRVMVRAVAVDDVVAAVKAQTVNQLFIQTLRNAPRRNKV
jgi:hypothetical protein